MKIFAGGDICTLHIHTSLKPVGLMSLSWGEIGAINLPFCFCGLKANHDHIWKGNTNATSCYSATHVCQFVRAMPLSLSEKTEENKEKKRWLVQTVYFLSPFLLFI